VAPGRTVKSGESFSVPICPTCGHARPGDMVARRKQELSGERNMAILKIAKMGHPVLAKVAEPVANADLGDARRLVADMVETMADANGAGLAAPQVHVSQRIVVFHAPPERTGAGANGGDDRLAHSAPLTVLINPVIEILNTEMEEGWEGCLSVPGLRGLVPRYLEIRYRGTGLDGEPVDRRASGFHARVVQHECDHLDGILYPQRMTDLSNLIFETEFRHRVGPAVDVDLEGDGQ